MKANYESSMFGVLLVVGFVCTAGQSGWSTSNFTFASGVFPLQAGCDVATFPSSSPEGMVVLPNGQVLVAAYGDAIYTFTMPSSVKNCPATPPAATKLGPAHLRGMATDMNGVIYGNDLNGYVNTLNPNTGVATPVPGLPKVNGLGMALDPRSGDIFVTVDSGVTASVYQISGLSGSTPSSSQYVSLGQVSTADGLSFSCDGRWLLVADVTGDQVAIIDRDNNKSIKYVSFTPGTHPDGVAFGAAGTGLQNYAFTNTLHGELYRFSYATPGTATLVASNGLGGDFVTVDANGNLLATQTSNTNSTQGLITAVFLKNGNGTGGYVLPGGALCMSMHCATVAAAAVPSCAGVLNQQNASTITALADAACATSMCGGCASVNLNLQALLTIMNDVNYNHCLDSAITAATTLYYSCPCSPIPGRCITAIPYIPESF